MANNNGNNNYSGLGDVSRKIMPGNRVAGIIVSIIMIVLGILMFIVPVGTSVVIMYMASAGFIIYGIYQIIAYIRTAKEMKNGWTLASGIIYTILGILLLIGGPYDMAYTFMFLLAFLALSGGIMQISAYGPLKKAGAQGTGWMLASGIINVLLGIFFIFMPFGSALAVTFIFGIYLIVFGIAFFAESASGHHAKKL